MPWNYKYNSTLKIFEAKFSGRVTAQDLKESTSELIAAQKDKGTYRLLIDTTEMVFNASITDIYDLPDKQYIEEEADRSSRVAVIFPASHREKEAVQFYETVCTNRGWNVQAFSERQEAINWLTTKTSSKNR